jgi:cellobiose PTS system EIIC component
VEHATRLLNRYVVPTLSAISENTYMSAIRAGMVSVVSLTIIGGFFIIVSHLPIAGWETLVAPYQQLLQVPVTATFGLLSVFVCFAIGYDLGKQLEQEAIVSAMIATLIFLMIQIDLDRQALSMDNLGSNGLFTAIIVALVAVRVQKFFADTNLVIKLPENVPPVVYESLSSVLCWVWISTASCKPLSNRWCLLSIRCPAYWCTPCWSRCSGPWESTAITPWTPLWRPSSSNTWRPMWKR